MAGEVALFAPTAVAVRLVWNPSGIQFAATEDSVL
jgi:hypothetical protein